MEDFNSLARQASNWKIVNKDLIELEDRNIDNVVINCYSNLVNCKLAAYTIDYADTFTEFKCEYKAQVDKIKSKHKSTAKNKKEDYNNLTDGELKDVLQESGVRESINVRDIHNNYKILKLKYFLNPIDTFGKKYVRKAIDMTLEAYDRVTQTYQHVLPEAREYLEQAKIKVEEMHKNGELDDDSDVSPTELEDLFIKEQIVLIPVYEGDGKYTIDGSKYYGVFNNVTNGSITKLGKYGFKTFKNGRINTFYIAIYGEVLMLHFFKQQVHNIIHVLSDKSALEIQSIWEVFPHTDDPELIEVYERTLEHAKWVELKDPRINDPKFKERPTYIDPKKNASKKDLAFKATFADTAYRKSILKSIQEYIQLRRNPAEGQDRKRYFEFLGNLENAIYVDINDDKLNRKDKYIKDYKRRINIQPLTILKIIKRGGNDKTGTLFVNTSSEPNPFDIFYLMYFIRNTHHTQTSSNKNTAKARLTDAEKLLKYDDLDYLGEFAPKSEDNIGIATTIRVGLSSENIVTRKSKS